MNEKTSSSPGPSAGNLTPSSLGNLPRQTDPQDAPAAGSGRAGLLAAVGELPEVKPKVLPLLEVDSTSTDPNLSGPIEIAVSPVRLFLRWSGESTWVEAEWYEVLWLLQIPRPDYAQELRDLRSDAFEQGFKAGVQAHRESIQQRQTDESDAAKARVLLRMKSRNPV